jgi:hypothetical protein
VCVWTSVLLVKLSIIAYSAVSSISFVTFRRGGDSSPIILPVYAPGAETVKSNPRFVVNTRTSTEKDVCVGIVRRLPISSRNLKKIQHMRRYASDALERGHRTSNTDTIRTNDKVVQSLRSQLETCSACKFSIRNDTHNCTR